MKKLSGYRKNSVQGPPASLPAGKTGRAGTVIKTILFLFVLIFQLYAVPSTLYPTFAQNFNVSSVYQMADKDAISGDIIISDGPKGFVRGNVAYDSRVFGVLNDKPAVVLREATASARPILRIGDTLVNVTNYNDQIKKGDYVTTSPVKGKGMKAGQSGYVLGIALDDGTTNGKTETIEGKQIKHGTVKVALRIEYAELTTARNSIRLLDQLNASFFRNIQNPEKFTLTIRYIIAGLLALIGLGLAFYSISRALAKGVEAIGRNPLAKQSIITSMIIQFAITLVAAGAVVAFVFIIIKF